MDRVERPHPPGDYPVLVIGSGPGGLQIAYLLRRRGINAAILSADHGPGGMFRRFPNYGRLLSWTKPKELRTEVGERADWYDWNALLADPADRVDVSDFIDSGYLSPTRQQMVGALEAFVHRSGIEVRHDCHWESTVHERDGFAVSTSDGVYRCQVLVMATGMGRPWQPSIPGLDLVTPYQSVEEPSAYRGKRVFVLGKQNSGFEIADALWPHARQVIVASPEPTLFTVTTGTMAGARARYVQPYEDHLLGGGTSVLDAALESVEKRGNGFVLSLQGTTVPAHLRLEVDEVIAATGFTSDLGDLSGLGLSTFNRGRLPRLTDMWESATVPNLFFAGTLMQAARGLRKNGIPSNSGAIQGYRYNTSILVDYLAETRFGLSRSQSVEPPEGISIRLLHEATNNPALHCQRGYLSWTAVERRGGWFVRGLLPLTRFLDDDGGDGLAVSVEQGADGTIAPVVYLRTSRAVEEHRLDPDPLFDFSSNAHRAQLTALIATM